VAFLFLPDAWLLARAAVLPPSARGVPKLNGIEQLLWLPPNSNGLSPTLQTQPGGPPFSSAAALVMVTNQFSANVMGDSAPGVSPWAHWRDDGESSSELVGSNNAIVVAQAAMLADAQQKMLSAGSPPSKPPPAGRPPTPAQQAAMQATEQAALLGAMMQSRAQSGQQLQRQQQATTEWEEVGRAGGERVGG
jgi:hypothetical protein